MTEGWQQLVMYRLDEAKRELDEIKTELHNVRDDIVSLKIKAGIWGLGAGAIPAVIAAAAQFLR